MLRSSPMVRYVHSLVHSLERAITHSSKPISKTGAGKSFTMFGPDISRPQDKGIIPRACEYVFDPRCLRVRSSESRRC